MVQTKSKKRIADYGEVLTPWWLVQRVLDGLDGEGERLESRVLDLGCATGNFLVQVVERKLKAMDWNLPGVAERGLFALMNTYGVELLADNVAECRHALLAAFTETFAVEDEEDFLHKAARKVLELNIVQGDGITLKNADADPLTLVQWRYRGGWTFTGQKYVYDLDGTERVNRHNSTNVQNATWKPRKLGNSKEWTISTLAAGWDGLGQGGFYAI